MACPHSTSTGHLFDVNVSINVSNLLARCAAVCGVEGSTTDARAFSWVHPGCFWETLTPAGAETKFSSISGCEEACEMSGCDALRRLGSSSTPSVLGMCRPALEG